VSGAGWVVGPPGSATAFSAANTPTPPEGWPNIGDYWPDAPQRMGPPADVHEEPGAAPTRIGAPWQEGGVRAAVVGRPAAVQTGAKRGRMLLGAGLAVLVLLGGGFVAYRKMAHRDPGPVAAAPPVVPGPTASGDMGPAVVLPEQSPSSTPGAAPPGGAARPRTGTFLLVDDVSEITIRTARLGDGIVQVAAPGGSDAVPRTTVDGGDVQVRVPHPGRRTDLDVQLDSRVSWAIRLGGGARQVTVDLGGADVRSVAFDGGAARIDLKLPRLGGTLPISMSGGVRQWQIATDGRVKVQLVARRGGGNLVLYGNNRGGLRRGQRISADGRDGIDVDATAGFGSLTVIGA
jgi:hypothetical protein